MSFELIVFIVLLIDSIVAVLLTWIAKENWYLKNFRLISRWFPQSRGWSLWYLVLTLWIGYLTM